MLPEGLLENRRYDKKPWYCPNGHEWSFQEGEFDRVRRERDQLKQETARLEDERRMALATANEQAEQRKKAERELKRVRARFDGGVCPCCNRTFQNVARHMKSKHPNITPISKTA